MRATPPKMNSVIEATGNAIVHGDDAVGKLVKEQGTEEEKADENPTVQRCGSLHCGLRQRQFRA